MKKLIVIAAALLVGLQANAQLIFNGGYLHATEKTSFTGKNAKGENATFNGTDALDGFYAGAKYRFGLDGITEGLSVAPGANVSFLFGRHGSIDNLDPVGDRAILNEVAVNVPLHVQYLYEITPDFKIEAWAGPTFQLALYDRAVDSDDNPTFIYNHLKTIPEISLLGVTYTREVPARSPFNLYLGLGVGVEVSELVHVNIGYDFGLLNLSTNSSWNVRRGLLRVGVGYNF